MSRRRSVIIVGGGIWRSIRSAGSEVGTGGYNTIDQHNYHLFQPLLYQVATGSLSAGEIAAPLRSVLSRQKNARVLLGTVLDIDPLSKHVLVSRSPMEPKQRNKRFTM